MEEKPMYGGLTVYRERGAYLRRLEQFEKAKASYDEAFRFAPEDVRMLTGRSQLYADVIKPVQAYNDAELALKLEPHNMLAKSMQARAQHTTSEFEKSAVSNYRGYRVRKQPPYFKEGIDQGIEAIQDCIGVNAGDVMLDFLPLIKQNEGLIVDDGEPHKSLHVSRIPKVEVVQKLTQMQARKKLILSRVLAMKYLGPMAYDKFFLQELQKDPRLKSANSLGSKELKSHVDEILSSLITRQEMLRAQRPYYSIKLAERAVSHRQIKYKQWVLKEERNCAILTADRYMAAVNRYLQKNIISQLMIVAQNFQNFLDTKTPRILHDKAMYMDKLYKALGEGYLTQYRLSYNLSENGNRRRVAFLMGMKIGRATSFDSVMATFPHRYETVAHAIERLEQILHMCENKLQRCWLQYELSLLSGKQKNFALGKYYAKRCQEGALELKSNVWWMNGCFAMMCGDMQQGNANEVCAQVEEALEWCKELAQGERVRAFLMKAREMVLEPVVMDDRQATVQREQEILKILDDVSRVDTEVLFKRMSTVPSRRQFSVLPRKQEQTQNATDRRKYLQTGLTVVPGPDRPLRRPPVSPTLGFQIFDM